MTTSIYDHEQNVLELQTALRNLHQISASVPLINPDGYFGNETRNAVLATQEYFGILQTGEVDFETWDLLFSVYPSDL